MASLYAGIQNYQMQLRSTLNIGDSLHSKDTKRSLNERMFGEIAPHYDFITRVMSFGQDRTWKHRLVQLLPNRPDSHCVDLASGTGDLAFMLAAKYPQGKVIGLDITPLMLKLARARNAYPHVEFMQGDMGAIGLPSESVDIVTGGYALRNAPDLETTLQEIHRILKPGGIGAFLDFSKPRHPRKQRLEYWILKLWTGLWGLLLHRNHQVYSYIAESLAHYPDRETLRALLAANKLVLCTHRTYFFGITETVIVQKM